MKSISKSKSLWGGLAFLVLMIGFMRHTAIERPDITLVEKLIRDAYTPLQSGVNEFKDGLRSLGTIFSSKRVLAEQNRELTRELSLLKQQNQVLLEYRYENERLRKMLDLRQRTSDRYRLVAAQVIARSPELWYKSLTIDRGEANGLTRNMVVITPDGLVGRITSTSSHTSEVMLISDRESAVGTLVQSSRTQGLVEGMGDRSMLKMVNIAYDAPLRPGQWVVTSGLSEIFPEGIRVGKIVKVGSEPNGLLKYAVVKPAVNFDKVEEVFVIIDNR